VLLYQRNVRHGYIEAERTAQADDLFERSDAEAFIARRLASLRNTWLDSFNRRPRVLASLVG
jgi:hypothetical protein